MDILCSGIVALFGLAFGSFLTAVIYRLPRRIRVRSGRSRCPACGTRLRWYHNVPILSYFVLGGKCAFCGRRISLTYPLVESLNTLLYLYFLWQFGLNFSFLISALLASTMLAIFFIDLEFQIIPDLITIPGMAVGLLVSLIPGGVDLLESIIGLLVGGGSLYLMAVLGDWLFKKESMGGGDIKMAAMLGAFLGWGKIIFIFIAAAVIAVVASGLIMMFSSRLRRTRVVPFGPFLASATVLAIAYGDRIIALYLSTVVNVS